MKEKVLTIDSLAHGSSHHFYLYGQSRGWANNNVDVTLYTNNVTQNPNYEGVSFFTFIKIFLRVSQELYLESNIYLDRFFHFYMPNSQGLRFVIFIYFM